MQALSLLLPCWDVNTQQPVQDQPRRPQKSLPNGFDSLQKYITLEEESHAANKQAHSTSHCAGSCCAAGGCLHSRGRSPTLWVHPQSVHHLWAKQAVCCALATVCLQFQICWGWMHTPTTSWVRARLKLKQGCYSNVCVITLNKQACCTPPRGSAETESSRHSCAEMFWPTNKVRQLAQSSQLACKYTGHYRNPRETLVTQHKTCWQRKWPGRCSCCNTCKGPLPANEPAGQVVRGRQCKSSAKSAQQYEVRYNMPCTGQTCSVAGCKPGCKPSQYPSWK